MTIRLQFLDHPRVRYRPQHPIRSLALAVLAAAPATADVSIATNTLVVSATVVPSCRISSGGQLGEPAGSVTSSCTGGAAYSVSVARNADLFAAGGVPQAGVHPEEPAVVTISY